MRRPKVTIVGHGPGAVWASRTFGSQPGVDLTIHGPRAIRNSDGSSRAALPADSAEDADLLILDIPDAAAYEDAVFELGGVVETLPTGGRVIDLSPAPPWLARLRTGRFARYGIRCADAALLGAPPERNRAPYTLMLATDLVADPLVSSLLESRTTRLVAAGPSGNACALRIALEQAFHADGPGEALRVSELQVSNPVQSDVRDAQVVLSAAS